MRQNRSMPAATVIPELVYEDVEAAVDWLCDRFGFTVRWRAGGHRAQLAVGDGAVVVMEPSNVLPGGHSQATMVRVEDVDGHHAAVSGAGVTVLAGPEDFPYGERQYTAEDLARHRWTFSQTIEDVDPSDWGGTAG